MNKGTNEMADTRWEDNQALLEASVRSADRLVPALAEIVRNGSWREFVHPMRGLQRHSTFAGYCEDSLEWSVAAIEAALATTTRTEDAQIVREELAQGLGTFPTDDVKEAARVLVQHFSYPDLFRHLS